MTTKRNSNKMIEVSLHLHVEKMMRYTSSYYWGRNPWNDTETMLFIYNGRYFRYGEHSSYTWQSKWLSEIGREEYEEAIKSNKELPWDDEGRMDDGKTRYHLVELEEYDFSEMLNVNSVETSCSAILKMIEDAVAKVEAEEEAAAAEWEKSKKDYARNCGKVSRRMKIAFVNVLRLGYEDEERLLSFQQSMLEAKSKLAAMPKKERKEMLHELSCGRARKSNALEFLGVQTFGKDVNYMDFSELYK